LQERVRIGHRVGVFGVGRRGIGLRKGRLRRERGEQESE
jgi:hypothetical protein